MSFKIIILITAATLACTLLVGCSKQNPVVTLSIEGRDDIKIELYPKKAPNTVNSFISLVEDGYYDGLTFHRIIPGFVIQGGDPNGDGTGGPGYTIKGEFASNGYKKNDLKHTEGIVSMARAPAHPDTAGSQFFIVLGDASHLDGEHAAFGKVIEGMDVAEEIASVDTSNDTPKEAQIIEKATVELFGAKYKEPEKIIRD